MSNNKKAIFIGPEHYCMAFSLAGIRGVGVKNSDEAKEKIKELKEQYDLIFVSQDVYKENSSEGVVAVPGMKNEKEEGYLKEEIKKAIGIEINIQPKEKTNG